MAGNERIRVAVIGGGCASLTTAFELSRPEHDGRYDVTVYQLGWRLGGKGASGRGVGDRIEEHGLHLWMGFYENAFRLMRECYEARHAAHPELRFAHWYDAFKPAPEVGISDATRDGWDFWLAHFPALDGLPGDGNMHASIGVGTYLQHTVTLLGELIRSASREAPLQQTAAEPQFESLDALTQAASRLLRYGELASYAAVVEAWGMLKAMTAQFFPLAYRGDSILPVQLLDRLSAAASAQIASIVEEDLALRRIWHVIELVLACLKGSIKHGLAFDPRGFDAINDYEWRAWLRENGASEGALDSGFMRGIYDLTFAYEDGDIERPRLAAGVALRGAMRMFFTYRGSLFWKMSGGMGDVVFAPLYQVLKDRGVRFEFFHKLTHIGLAEADRIARLEFDVQARPQGEAYDPLTNVHGVPSWPARPLYDRLQDGSDLRGANIDFEGVWDTHRVATKVLRDGDDFDCVVLGVSVGALPAVASELIDRSPRWRRMVKHVKTVPTQALQLWLTEDVEALGWQQPGVNVSGFVEPFDTWADMSHLIAEERWDVPVRSIAYFCSVLRDTDGVPDGEAAAAQGELVRRNAVQFYKRDAPALWPGLLDATGAVRWQLLAAQPDQPYAEKPGKGRMRTQFWTANVNPTDRYVLSLPGSLTHRISPLALDFANLTIAGDWTASGLDSGCVESAVMSGLLAAHALSGSPRLESIVGYDHP